jgi:glycosyltransferase involved in cell wall biosynthesis
MLAPATAALVIPAWNEPEAIGPLLSEVPPESVDRILVVVGSQSDPTAAVAQAHGARVLVQHQPGYGAACWTGAQAALADGFDLIAFLDGDYADPPSELERVLAPLRTGEADLVLGCRDLSQHPDSLPPHARFGNQVVLGVLRLLLGRRLADLPSFKAIRADALRQLEMREMTYGWTVEMLVKATRTGLRVREVDVVYRPRLGGRSKVAGDARASVRAAARLLGCAVAYSTMRWSVSSG